MTDMPSSDDTLFVVELLRDLQKSRFSLPGWKRFLGQSWERSQVTAKAHPLLVQAWLSFTILISFLALLISVGVFYFEGASQVLRFLPGFLFFVAWQQSDLYWHLGLNRDPQTGKFFEQLGLANMLTWLRALCASFLLARLLSGLATSPAVAFSVFLLAILTDILDGFVARGTHNQTRLGQIADGETDFCLILALTFILFQHALLPLWLVCLLCLRFLFPFLAALMSYFLLARPVRFGSTIWGKYAGIVQSLYFCTLLLPLPFQNTLPFPFQNILFIIRGPLLLVLLILLILAPLAQFWPYWSAQLDDTLNEKITGKQSTRLRDRQPN